MREMLREKTEIKLDDKILSNNDVKRAKRQKKHVPFYRAFERR